ncbi:peroxidase [Candidatus Pacearchaeota archaeon]|nr:peroxidase [Candidatus Pacearchaeota archaeon]
MSDKPWDFKEELTEERLVKMASFIAMVRGEVIDRHDEDLGDTRLSLGMRAYECSRTRIINESASGAYPWLGVVTPDKRFTFSIGSVPVRFSRNDPKFLPEKKLIVSTEAGEQMKMFSVTSEYADIRWFFVFDTHFKHAADNVYFVGYTDTGEILCQWEIPIEDAVTLVTKIESSKPQAVELPEPAVTIKRVQKKTESESSND